MENLPQTNEINYLLPIEIQAISKVSEVNKPFIEVRNSQKFNTLEANDAIKFLFDSMTSSILVSGLKNESSEAQIKMASQMLYAMLLETQKGITLQEIKKAFKMGLCEELGGFIGFGLASFSGFIRKYMNDSRRQSAMKEWMAAQDEPQITEKPTAELFAQSEPIAKAFFEVLNKENAKRIGTIYTDESNNIFHLPALYDWLRQHYHFEIGEKSKDYIITTAKMAYAKFIKDSGIIKTDKIGYNSLVDSVKRYTYEDLIKTVEGYNMGDNKTFDYYIKSEALKVIFLTLKERGKTIDNLIKK